mgnify:FL=1
MTDPRINPNYRGIKCKGCGEYLPFMLTDLCAACTHERDQNSIERLQAEVERLRKALQKIIDEDDSYYLTATVIAEKALAEPGE